MHFERCVKIKNGIDKDHAGLKMTFSLEERVTPWDILIAKGD